MSDCCGTCLNAEFDERNAKNALRGYRRRGPGRETRLLIGALADAGVAGATLLDIGSGVGAVHGELLTRGAERATSVDASRGFEQAARELASERGYADRVVYRSGDFVDVASEVAPADVATLDKVVCCYPDMERLVGLSAERARRLYGLVYPRDGAIVRAIVRLHNVGRRLFRSDFRAYVHPRSAVAALLREHGFRPRSTVHTTLWAIEVYER